MLRERQKFLSIFLAMVVLTLGCSGNLTTQTVVELPTDTFTVTALIDTPVKPLELPVSSTGTALPPKEINTPLPLTPTAELPFAIVRIFPSEVDLATRLAVEVEKAYSLGYTPVVEFDAHW